MAAATWGSRGALFRTAAMPTPFETKLKKKTHEIFEVNELGPLSWPLQIEGKISGVHDCEDVEQGRLLRRRYSVGDAPSRRRSPPLSSLPAFFCFALC